MGRDYKSSDLFILAANLYSVLTEHRDNATNDPGYELTIDDREDGLIFYYYSTHSNRVNANASKSKLSSKDIIASVNSDNSYLKRITAETVIDYTRGEVLNTILSFYDIDGFDHNINLIEQPLLKQ